MAIVLVREFSIYSAPRRRRRRASSCRCRGRRPCGEWGGGGGKRGQAWLQREGRRFVCLPEAAVMRSQGRKATRRARCVASVIQQGRRRSRRCVDRAMRASGDANAGALADGLLVVDDEALDDAQEEAALGEGGLGPDLRRCGDEGADVRGELGGEAVLVDVGNRGRRCRFGRPVRVSSPSAPPWPSQRTRAPARACAVKHVMRLQTPRCIWRAAADSTWNTHLGRSHGGHAPAAEQLQIAGIIARHVVLRERRPGDLRRVAERAPRFSLIYEKTKQIQGQNGAQAIGGAPISCPRSPAAPPR